MVMALIGLERDDLSSLQRAELFSVLRDAASKSSGRTRIVQFGGISKIAAAAAAYPAPSRDEARALGQLMNRLCEDGTHGALRVIALVLARRTRCPEWIAGLLLGHGGINMVLGFCTRFEDMRSGEPAAGPAFNTAYVRAHAAPCCATTIFCARSYRC